MKFAAAIAAVATFAATANAAACPPGETLRLIGLAFEPSLGECQKDSGYTFIPPPGPPTTEQVDKMCASEACPKTIAALQKLKPNDCDLTFSNGVTLNIKGLLDTLVPACDARRIHINSACPPEETQKLLQLAFEPSLEQCQEDSGFFFIPPSGEPTSEQVDKMCASEACPKTIAALSALNPSDCDLTFSNGVTLNVKKLIDTLVPTCGFRR